MYLIAKYTHTHIPPIVRKEALNVLIQQPEVDPKRISLIGHYLGRALMREPHLVVLLMLVIMPDSQNCRPYMYLRTISNGNTTIIRNKTSIDG